MKSSKDIPEILSMIDTKKNQITLKISPIKMFTATAELTGGLIGHNNGRGLSGFQIPEREEESDNTSESDEMNTFRSQDVDEALEKAQ